MRHALSSSLALILGSGIAAVSAQTADPWAGAYGGATWTTGDAFQVYDSGPSYDLEGDGFGLMLGYNYATGPWVIGAELAYSKAKIGELPPDTDYTFTSFLDLKGRAGYAVNSFLFYGTLGATFTKWDEGAGNGPFDGDGFLYGVGVDYLVAPRFFVGAEYLARDVKSDWTTGGATFDADVDSFSLRAGLKF